MPSVIAQHYYNFVHLHTMVIMAEDLNWHVALFTTMESLDNVKNFLFIPTLRKNCPKRYGSVVSEAIYRA